jgi:single-strand DNA-binding protein
MPNYCQCTAIGTLVRAPEVRFLASEKAVANVTIAVNERYKKTNGDQHEETMFLDCVLWGRLGEIIGQYADKGDPIMLAGNLRQENWESKEGQKRSKIVLNVREMQFLGNRQQGQQNSGRSESSPVPPPADLGDDSPPW